MLHDCLVLHFGLTDDIAVTGDWCIGLLVLLDVMHCGITKRASVVGFFYFRTYRAARFQVSSDASFSTLVVWFLCMF